MITQNITLTLNSDPPFLSLKMRQGDNGRMVVAQIVDTDGQAFNMDGISAEFRAAKPDGTVIARTEGVSTIENAVAVEITANTLAVAGLVNCEIILSQLGTYVGTVVWRIEVWAAVVPEQDLMSSDDFQSIIEAVGLAESYRDGAEQYAADASTSEANAARSAADAAASAAETAGYSANPPYLGDNGNWWVWDGTAYVDSGKTWQASGGYMERADYDADDSVLTAGGIKPFVAGQIAAIEPDIRVGQMYVYSTSETRVGTWIDGKSIYRKVLSTGTLPNNGAREIATGISAMDRCTSLTGMAANSSGATVPMPHMDPNTPANSIRLYLTTNGTIARITSGGNYSSYSGYIVMEYTKTTG